MLFRKLFLLLFPLLCLAQQPDLYSRDLKMMSNKDRQAMLRSDLRMVEGKEFANYIEHMKLLKISTRPLKDVFIEKAQNTPSPYDLLLSANVLLQDDRNNEEVQQILLDRQAVWDTGDWSNYFRQLADRYHFTLPEKDVSETEPTDGQNTYGIEEYIQEQKEAGNLGENPALLVDNKLIDYPEGELLNTIKEFQAVNAEVINKEKAIPLYGARGVDGILKLNTKQ